MDRDQPARPSWSIQINRCWIQNGISKNTHALLCLKFQPSLVLNIIRTYSSLPVGRSAICNEASMANGKRITASFDNSPWDMLDNRKNGQTAPINDRSLYSVTRKMMSDKNRSSSDTWTGWGSERPSQAGIIRSWNLHSYLVNFNLLKTVILFEL